MKKLLAFIMSLVVIGGSASFDCCRTKAFEAATMREWSEQVKEKEKFPDPELKYTVVESGDYIFKVYDEFAVLYECSETSITEAVIPDEVNGVPVVGIEGTPFGECRNLTSITIPDCFDKFEWFNLTCTTMVNINSTEELQPSVSEIKVSDTNPNFTVKDGILYTEDMKTLVGCPSNLDINELNIPEETERIGDYAFFSCTSLKTAAIPENIKYINNSAFTACINLKSVSFPSKITKISGDMFYCCTSLTDVEFKGKIQTIGYGAFYECNSLENFKIPDTVTYIGQSAFENTKSIENRNGIYYCDNWVVGSDEDIKEIVIDEGIIGIAEMSFFLRDDVEYVSVPKTIENIGEVVVSVSGSYKTHASVIDYKAPFINESSIRFVKNLKDIYIYDSECDIFESERTIPETYKILNPEYKGLTIYGMNSDNENEEYITGEVVIHGYEDSTAQKYAEKYGRKFEVIENSSVKGDANGDGEFNIADAVSLQKWLIGDSNEKEMKSADLNGDGQTDIFDLCVMRRILTEKTK